MLPIEDIFSIEGRGTVVTGRVERGIIHTGDEIEIIGIKDTQKYVTGVEMFRKSSTRQAGDNVGILLRGTKKEEVQRGQVLAKPVRLTRTLNSKVRYMYYLKMKEVDILHSSKDIVLSFILEQRM